MGRTALAMLSIWLLLALAACGGAGGAAIEPRQAGPTGTCAATEFRTVTVTVTAERTVTVFGGCSSSSATRSATRSASRTLSPSTPSSSSRSATNSLSASRTLSSSTPTSSSITLLRTSSTTSRTSLTASTTRSASRTASSSTASPTSSSLTSTSPTASATRTPSTLSSTSLTGTTRSASTTRSRTSTSRTITRTSTTATPTFRATPTLLAKLDYNLNGARGIALADNGTIYGVSYAGGDYDVNPGCGDCGAVWRYIPGDSPRIVAYFIDRNTGGYPQGRPVPGADGAYYIPTQSGGPSGLGTVARYSPATGSISGFVGFNVSTGSSPMGSVVRGPDGNIYGTTTISGLYDGGTVFRAAQDGTLTILFHFGGPNAAERGSEPYSGLTLGADGLMYGATTKGGRFGEGTVFRISPAGLLSTLAHFNASTGVRAYDYVLRLADGSVVGTCRQGGANNRGTAWILRPSGELAVLAHMQGDRGGTTGMVEAGGWLYYGGTSTSYSSGRIMRVKADGSTGAEIVLTFSWYEGYPAGNGEPELFGGQPVDGLVLGDDGLLYGVTSGSLTGATGTLFALDVGLRQSTTSTRTATSTSRTATRTATRSASRTATRATFPAASPTVLFRISADLGTVTGIAEAPDGNFLGVARGFTGLTTANECGTLFSITPSGAFSVVHLFQDDGAGCFPETVPVYSSQCNCFYGTTSGRNGEEGTPSPPKIWALDAAGTVRAIATLPSGSDPMGRLAVGSDGTLYGALNQGGSVNDGAIFRLRPGSPAPEVFYQLARPSTGYRPVGGVSIGGNDTVYVTTLYGRTALNGTLLALWSDGGWSESQFGFGSMALDPPLAVGTDVFGLLSEGGPENCGSAYRWRRYVGSEQLFVFRGPSGVGGCTPRGPLIQIGGDLYGTTAAEIFRFPSSGDGGWAAGFANYSMADRDGIVLPLSGVLQGADGRLYGLAGPENEERTFYAVNLGLGPARQTTAWRRTPSTSTTRTPTATQTASATASATRTGTRTASPTETRTATRTASPTASMTATVSSSTRSASGTATASSSTRSASGTMTAPRPSSTTAVLPTSTQPARTGSRTASSSTVAASSTSITASRTASSTSRTVTSTALPAASSTTVPRPASSTTLPRASSTQTATTSSRPATSSTITATRSLTATSSTLTATSSSRTATSSTTTRTPTSTSRTATTRTATTLTSSTSFTSTTSFTRTTSRSITLGPTITQGPCPPPAPVVSSGLACSSGTATFKSVLNNVVIGCKSYNVIFRQNLGGADGRAAFNDYFGSAANVSLPFSTARQAYDAIEAINSALAGRADVDASPAPDALVNGAMVPFAPTDTSFSFRIFRPGTTAPNRPVTSPDDSITMERTAGYALAMTTLELLDGSCVPQEGGTIAQPGASTSTSASSTRMPASRTSTSTTSRTVTTETPDVAPGMTSYCDRTYFEGPGTLSSGAEVVYLRNVTVPPGGTIANVSVSLMYRHEYGTDASLAHPDGTANYLMSSQAQSCDFSERRVYFTFRDDTSVYPGDVANGTCESNTVKPREPFRIYRGKAPGGTWTLAFRPAMTDPPRTFRFYEWCLWLKTE